MIKVIVTGAESTGKTTIAMGLAERFSAVYIPEYSREYLTNLDIPYAQSDLLEIAKGQLRSEDLVEKNSEIVICDTSLLVIKVWSLYKYGTCDPWLIDQMALQDWDLFFLPHFDIPYEFDPLRENPNDRQELYHIYFRELSLLGVPFYVLRGSPKERLAQASKILKTLQD